MILYNILTLVVAVVILLVGFKIIIGKTEIKISIYKDPIRDVKPLDKRTVNAFYGKNINGEDIPE